MKFSIVIPIFNEKKNISELVFQIKKNLSKYKYEIIIVDDSSNDGSKRILDSLTNKYKNLKVIFRNNLPRDLSKSIIFKKNESIGKKIKNIGNKILKKTIKELDRFIIDEYKKT